MDIKAEKARRLRASRIKAGFSTPGAAAKAYGWGEAGYRHHENETRGFGADAARKYGRAFKVRPGYLMAMEGFDDTPIKVADERIDELVVSGSVQGGVWRDPGQPDEDPSYSILDLPSPVAGMKRFGITVRGRSMDEFYEPGTVLDCASIYSGGVQPQSGDHVIVERIRPDGLRELTVKEYLEEGGQHFLLPRSSDPKWKERIEIGAPDREYADTGEVHVIAFVVAHYPPRVLGLFERLKKIRR